MPSNTGYKGYNNLELCYADNGESLGITKTNSISDPDYIAPIYDPSYCPLPSTSPSVTPSVTRTPSVTPTVTITTTPSSTIPATLSVTPTVTQTPSVTPSIEISPSVTPTITVTPSSTPPTQYTVTVFGTNDDLTVTTTFTKAQWSTGSNTGPWADFGPTNNVEQVCNFMGSKQLLAGSNVYIRIVSNTGTHCRVNTTNTTTTTCPTTSGTLCSGSITNLSNSDIRAFYISTNNSC